MAESDGVENPTVPSAAGDLSGDGSAEFNGDTFITSLRSGGIGGGGGGENEKRTTLMEVSGMSRVSDLHEQLTGVVGTLSDKVAEVLKKQEDEFLSAYRAHMYNVQKELQVG